MKSKNAKKISIVEDMPEVMNFLKSVIHNSADYILDKCFFNAEEAIKVLPDSESSIVIVDIKLPDQDGIECVRQVKSMREEIQFLMYTQFDKNDDIFESLKAGASGYLLKSPKQEKILTALKELEGGGAPMSPSIARKVTSFFFENRPKSKFPELKSLSKREKEILGLLSKGLLYKEIAHQLNITTGTVKQHIHNIYQKLHVQNRTEAVIKFLGQG